MITKTQVPSYLSLELQAMGITTRLVFDVTKPNVITYSTVNGNYTILKDKTKWLSIVSENKLPVYVKDVDSFITMLKHGIASSIKSGRSGFAVVTNFPVSLMKK